jgi:class 3 adenylate cyclase
MNTDRSEIKFGIGINTGNLMAGYIGSSHTMSYSVIGDTVNTASRLCASAQPDQILISENTWNLVKTRFDATPLGMIHAKGKFKPVNAFRRRPGKTTCRMIVVHFFLLCGFHRAAWPAVALRRQSSML